VRPDRIRRIERGFAAVPNRFLQDGFFASLNHAERSLYFFLVLAGDRQGVSFYTYERICSILEMTVDCYIAARNSLIHKDLIAFDGTRFQVLSLPANPVNQAQHPLTDDDSLQCHDPATIRQLIQHSLGDTQR
jgi:hypothetical protein